MGGEGSRPTFLLSELAADLRPRFEARLRFGVGARATQEGAQPLDLGAQRLVGLFQEAAIVGEILDALAGPKVSGDNLFQPLDLGLQSLDLLLRLIKLLQLGLEAIDGEVVALLAQPLDLGIGGMQRVHEFVDGRLQAVREWLVSLDGVGHVLQLFISPAQPYLRDAKFLAQPLDRGALLGGRRVPLLQGIAQPLDFGVGPCDLGAQLASIILDVTCGPNALGLPLRELFFGWSHVSPLSMLCEFAHDPPDDLGALGYDRVTEGADAGGSAVQSTGNPMNHSHHVGLRG